MWNLSIENQENYDYLMQYLMNYAFDHKIGVEFSNKLPPFAPPVSYQNPGNLILMNSNWIYPEQIPFLLCHEIGHVLKGEASYDCINYMTKRQSEMVANLYAIKLLKEYCFENDFYFDNYYQFAKSFGIPKEIYYLFEI